jgi:hypothetical protein
MLSFLFVLTQLACSTPYLISEADVQKAAQLSDKGETQVALLARNPALPKSTYLRVEALDLSRARLVSPGQLQVRVPQSKGLRIAGVVMTVVGAGTLVGIGGFALSTINRLQEYPQLLCGTTCPFAGVVLVSGIIMTVVGFKRPIAEVRPGKPEVHYLPDVRL